MLDKWGNSMAQRTTLVQPGSGGAIATAGNQMAQSLQGLGYTVSKSISEVQEARDSSLQMATFNDITEQSANIYNDNKDDPQAFGEVFKDYSDNLLESMPAHMRGRTKYELDQNRIRREQQVSQNFETKQNRIKAGESWNFNVNAQNEILTEFRAGNMEHAGILLNELKTANLKSGLYTPEQIEQMDYKLIQSGTSQRITGEAERALKAGGYEELAGYRDSLETDEYGIFDNPEDKDRALNVVDGMLNAEKSRLKQMQAEQKAKQAATKKMYQSKVTGLVGALELGYEIDSEALTNASTALDVLDMPEDAVKLNRGIAARDFARLTAAEREDVLNQLLDKNPAEYSYFKNVNSKVSDLESKDPVLHYQRQGKVTVQPIDYSNPQSIVTRNQTVAELEELTGRTDIPLLTTSEQKRLVDTFGQLAANEKTSLVGQIVTGLGSDSINTLNSLSKKNGAMLALGGQLFMDGVPEVAESIFMGQEVMAGMKEIMPTDKDFTLELQTSLGTAYAENPLQRKTVSNAVKAVYADLANRDGDMSGVIDSARVQEATDLVTGGLIDYESGQWRVGGETSTIEPPVRGMTTDQFEDWVDSLTPDDVEKMGGSNMDGKELIRILQDEAQLTSVRVAGKPYPVYVIKTEAGAVANKDGTAPFYLEYMTEN